MALSPFQSAYGKPPKPKNDNDSWVLAKLSLLNPELQPLEEGISMDDRFRKILQDRFVERSLKSSIQLGLLEHLEQAIVHYASFVKRREMAIHVSRNWLFILVRLMGDLYLSKSEESHDPRN